MSLSKVTLFTRRQANVFFSMIKSATVDIPMVKMYYLIQSFIFLLLYRYNVQGFLDKNKDTLFQDFKRLLFNWYEFLLFSLLC